MRSPTIANAFELVAGALTVGVVLAFWVAQAHANVPHFSNPPTDDEILICGVLPQPLAPAGGAFNASENRALGQALIGYQESLQRGAMRDAVGPLTDFLRAYPDSRWRAALYLNLGIIYRLTGHMSKALDAWQRAWDLSKHATEPKARAIADYSVGKLAEFQAYLGRMETLAPLLAEVKGRPMHGSGAANISNASQGLAEMRTRPQDAFKCGPAALHRICLLQKRTDGIMALENSRSTTRGTSLVQVVALAHKVGLDYQMAYREPGAPLIVPAVMHWKVGHFAALIKEDGGLYQVEDPTFGENIRVSRATLDDEGTGYFAVPAGPLPKGWRPASQNEGERIWGRGFVGGEAPAGFKPIMAIQTCPTRGMTTVNAQAATVSLALHDAPLSYQTPKGPPVSFELSYSHRDNQQPAIFTYTNFGPKWTSNWISYITDNTSSTNTADLYAPGGGLESYVFNGTNYGPGLDDQAIVTSIISGGFTRELPDGSVQTFAQRFGSKQFFLTSVADPQGNKVSLTYDGFMRITEITDAAGERTTLTYGLASDKFKVTRATDPFGRSATFSYNSDGQLASITDVLGLTSSYSYLFDSGDFITTLNTPYGTSTFTYGDSTTDYRLGTTIFLTITDPLGQTQRVEFHQQAPGIPDSDRPNTVPAGMSTGNVYLSGRNTFVWNAHQLALATLPDGSFDYTKAKIFHWLHVASFLVASGVPESIKEPLENRVWYNYPNQGGPIGTGSSNQPTAIGRVLDDGSTQLATLAYNSMGNLAQITDPLGRQFTVAYAANGIDPLSIAMTTGMANQLLWSASYNSQHRPLTITDTAGQVTKFTYNSAGQILSIIDALNNTTKYAYGATGLLLSITRPLNGAVTTFTYDSANRVRSWTDSQGYQLLYSYDSADRPTIVTYPDGTTAQSGYKLLDPATDTDRLKHTTSYNYDSLRRLSQVTDPLGRTTKLTYCDCGAISQVTDPNGHQTRFNFDLQERPIAKIFADGTRTSVLYENTASRVKNTTDALGQVTNYVYNLDGTPKLITYTNAVNATPPVSFTWDPNFLRIIRMADGTGTTNYAYKPIISPPGLGAGKLASITGPHGDIISYSYDPLGRMSQAILDGVASQVTFDSLDRAATYKNPLDTFTISYLGATNLPVSISSLSGPSSTYTYFNNTGNERLKSVTNKTPGGSLISGFQYAYDVIGEVASTIIQGQFPTPVTRTMSYDAAHQLLAVISSAGSANSFAYAYDAVGNRISSKMGAASTTYTYNDVNEQTSPGPATYDKDGQPLTLGAATYQWDAANRLISVNMGGKTTRFAYDGFGRRARITKLTGSTISSDKFYFWGSDTPLLESDALNHNSITKRYFAQGVMVNGTPFYYAFDNLGSVHNLIDSGGLVRASYDYDPFGVRERLTGTMDSDFGFAGLFHETQSGLDLAMYRGYSAAAGRWLNRDPIYQSLGDPSSPVALVVVNPALDVSAAGGRGLGQRYNYADYSYGNNAPSNSIDPSGLWSLGGHFGGMADLGAGGLAGEGGSFDAAGGWFFDGLHYTERGMFSTTGGFKDAGSLGEAYRTLKYGTDSGNPPPPPSGKTYGAYAGFGPGGWISNASSRSDVLGDFTTRNVNIGYKLGVDISFSTGYNAKGERIWFLSFTAGPALGASYSKYHTFTQCK